MTYLAGREKRLIWFGEITDLSGLAAWHLAGREKSLIWLGEKSDLSGVGTVGNTTGSLSQARKVTYLAGRDK